MADPREQSSPEELRIQQAKELEEYKRQALEFQKQEYEEARKRSKEENKLLEILGQQSLAYEIHNNLKSEYNDYLADTTDILKRVNEYTKSNVNNIAQQLGFAVDENEAYGLLLATEEEILKVKLRIAEAQRRFSEATDIAAQNSLRDLVDLKQEELSKLETSKDTIRANQLLEGIFNRMPGSMKDLISKTGGLTKQLRGAGIAAGGAAIAIAGAAIAVGALLKLAWDNYKGIQEVQGEIMRDTGLLRNRTDAWNTTLRESTFELARLGVTFQTMGETVSQIVTDFTDMVSNRTMERFTKSIEIVRANLGVSRESASGFLALMVQSGGYSQNTAEAMLLTSASLIGMTKLSPQKIFQDIAESSEEILLYMDGSLDTVVAQAIALRRMGSSLKEALGVAEGLLDFQTSLTNELETSVFFGQNINLGYARQLAYLGDISGMQNEVLNQVSALTRDRELTVFHQRKLTELTGLSIQQINKELWARRQRLDLEEGEIDLLIAKAGSLEELQGMNESELNTLQKQVQLEQKRQTQYEKFQNSLNQLKMVFTTALLPVIEEVMDIMESLSDTGDLELMASALRTIVRFTLIPMSNAIVGIVSGLQSLSLALSSVGAMFRGDMGEYVRLNTASMEAGGKAMQSFARVSPIVIAYDMMQDEINKASKQNDFIFDSSKSTIHPFDGNDTVIGMKNPMDTSRLESKLDEIAYLLKNGVVASVPSIKLNGMQLVRGLERGNDRPAMA